MYKLGPKNIEAVKNIANKGSGNQVLGQIKKIPGVKQSEIILELRPVCL